MKRLIILLALGCCVQAAAAQDSLAVYLAVAARDNPAVRAARLAWQVSLERVPQAGAWEDPELEIGVLLKPMDLLDGRQIADVRLMQMFPWWGTRRAARDEARGMAAMAYEQFRQERDGLWLEVKTAWWELVSLREQAANLHASRDLTEVFKELIASRLSTSQGGLSDALRIELELAELDYSEAETASNLVAARARFNALLGRAADSPIAVPDSIVRVVAPTREFDPARNPMPGMADAEGRAALARGKMERKMGLPMIGVGVQYSVIGKRMAMEIPTTAMNGRDMVMPMVSVTLPVWRGKYRARIAESRLAHQAAEARRLDAQNTLKAEYVAARESLTTAQRRMELSERQASLTRAAHQLAVREFSVGRGSLTDVLEVQRQLLDYSLRRAAAIADYNKVVAAIEKLLSEPENADET